MIDYQEELDRYLEQIGELAHNKEYARLRDLFLPMEPADIALLLEESGPELMPLLYRLLPKETAAEVFVELEPESQEMLINGFSNTELKEVLDCIWTMPWTSWRRCPPAWSSAFWIRPRRRCANLSTRS